MPSASQQLDDDGDKTTERCWKRGRIFSNHICTQPASFALRRNPCLRRVPPCPGALPALPCSRALIVFRFPFEILVSNACRSKRLPSNRPLLPYTVHHDLLTLRRPGGTCVAPVRTRTTDQNLGYGPSRSAHIPESCGVIGHAVISPR